MEIINKTKDTVLAKETAVADTLFKRLKGLLGKNGLNPGEALVLKPCNSIHMLFMRFPIDAVFVDKQYRVVKAIPGIQPWQVTGVYFSSWICIELPVGAIAASRTSPGDTLLFK